MIAENLLTHIKNVHKRSYIVRIVVLLILFTFLTIAFYDDIRSLTQPVEYKDFNSLYEISYDFTPYYYETPADFNNIYTFDTAYVDEDDNVLQYYAALINEDGYFVLAEVPVKLYDDIDVKQYIGHFVAVEEDLKAMILEDLIALDFSEQEAIDMMPSQLFKVEDNRTVSWFFVAILIIGYLYIIYSVIKFIGVLADSSNAAIQKQAALAGDADRILMDLERAPVHAMHPNFGVAGSNYILIHKNKINIIPSREVIWAYEHVYKKRVYFLFTVSKVHSLLLATKDKKYQVVLKANEIPSALETVNKTTPWLIFGYTKEIEQMYKNNRDYLISEVNRSYKETELDDEY